MDLTYEMLLLFTWSIMSRGSHLCGCVIHDFFGCQITFVPHQELVDVLAGVSVDLLQPLFDVVERFLIRNIVNDYDSVGPAIITEIRRRELNLDKLVSRFNNPLTRNN